MAKRDNTNFEDWKKEVYESINLIEHAENESLDELEKIGKMGCSGLFVKFFLRELSKKQKRNKPQSTEIKNTRKMQTQP